jgi:glycolate dehydrogenase FAD-linked subunit
MRAREEYLIFGAYAAGDASAAESELARTLGEVRGRMVEPAEAYRIWGSRFFPVSSAHAIPAPGRVLVPATRVGAVLDRLGGDPTEVALLGSVGRDGSALILAFASPAAEGLPLGLPAGSEAGLVGLARSVGGDLYHETLRRRAALRSRSARRS